MTVTSFPSFLITAAGPDKQLLNCTGNGKINYKINYKIKSKWLEGSTDLREFSPLYGTLGAVTITEASNSYKNQFQLSTNV